MPAERYFTGKPCKRGHLSERWLKTKICIECAGLLQKMSRKSNPGRAAGYCKDQRARWTSDKFEADRERAQLWRASNPEKAREAATRWRSKNLDKWAAKEHRRRARKAGSSGGSYTATDVQELLREQGGRCVYCPTEFIGRSYHVDHILPLVLGGGNDRSNIQILCPTCNLSKGSQHPDVFVLSRKGSIRCIQ